MERYNRLDVSARTNGLFEKFVILIYPTCRYIAPTKLYTIVIIVIIL